MPLRCRQGPGKALPVAEAALQPPCTTGYHVEWKGSTMGDIETTVSEDVEHTGATAADGGDSDSNGGNSHGGKGGSEDGGHSDTHGRVA